jgi:hypothetical protein
MTSAVMSKRCKTPGSSMNVRGYNNPNTETYIERWFRTLKEETVWLQEYSSFLESKKDIDHYIRFYNAELDGRRGCDSLGAKGEIVPSCSTGKNVWKSCF